jgi:hypothetical protein
MLHSNPGAPHVQQLPKPAILPQTSVLPVIAGCCIGERPMHALVAVYTMCIASRRKHTYVDHTDALGLVQPDCCFCCYCALFASSNSAHY